MQQFSAPFDVGGSLTEVSGGPRFEYWSDSRGWGTYGEFSQDSETLFALINCVEIVWHFNVNPGVSDRVKQKKQELVSEVWVTVLFVCVGEVCVAVCMSAY